MYDPVAEMALALKLERLKTKKMQERIQALERERSQLISKVATLSERSHRNSILAAMAVTS